MEKSPEMYFPQNLDFSSAEVIYTSLMGLRVNNQDILGLTILSCKIVNRENLVCKTRL